MESEKHLQDMRSVAGKASSQMMSSLTSTWYPWVEIAVCFWVMPGAAEAVATEYHLIAISVTAIEPDDQAHVSVGSHLDLKQTNNTVGPAS